MRIPPIYNFGNFGVVNSARNATYKKAASCSMIKPLKNDTVSFGSSAKYIRKYNTLPDEIKEELSPKDAIDMFRDMETIARGLNKGQKVGKGEEGAYLYENPWLDDCYVLILANPNAKTQKIYSNIALKDAIWSDADDPRIQIVKAA